MQYLILDKRRIVLEHEEVVDVVYTLPPKADNEAQIRQRKSKQLLLNY